MYQTYHLVKKLFFMNKDNNSVTLQNTQTHKMKPVKLIYYSIDELYNLYPTIISRGWTNETFATWIDQDVLSGIYEDDDLNTVKVEKESFEDFLNYHTTFIKKRVKRVQKGFENLKVNLNELCY